MAKKAIKKPAPQSAKAKGKGEMKKPKVVIPSAAQRWVNMMVNPLEDNVVRSPAGLSTLGTKARIVHNTEITGTDTDSGYFSAIARPSCVDPLVVSTKPVLFPSGGGLAALSATSEHLNYSSDAAQLGYADTGAYKVGSDDDSVLLRIEDYTDGASVTHPALVIDTQSASFFTATVINNSSNLYYFQLARAQPNWTNIGVVTGVPAKSSVTFSISQFAASSGSAIACRMCKANGADASPKHDVKSIHVDYTFASASVKLSTNPGSIGSFAKQDLVEAGHVVNARVTAISMLATSFANQTQDDGEIVAGDVRQSIAFNGSNVLTLMNNIKALPEGNRWHSGALKHGAYAYYVPDDLESYEPKHYDDKNFGDNCVVICGKMNASGGIIRLQTTWIVEFYTRAQLFERSMGPTWTREHKLALTYLQTTKMASANDSHETMAHTISRNVAKAWNWIMSHQAEIEAGATVIGQALLAV